MSNSKKGRRTNKEKTYSLINTNTKKVFRYLGRLQYFRSKILAVRMKKELEKELKLKLEIVKNEDGRRN